MKIIILYITTAKKFSYDKPKLGFSLPISCLNIFLNTKLVSKPKFCYCPWLIEVEQLVENDDNKVIYYRCKGQLESSHGKFKTYNIGVVRKEVCKYWKVVVTYIINLKVGFVDEIENILEN